jgi:hypothetical protein
MIDKYFRKLAAIPCWGVQWERNLNVSMSFGVPRLKIREPRRSSAKSEAVRRVFAHRNVTLKGDWWLWIFCARWTLSIRGLRPVRSTGSERRIRQALRLLDGQRLVDVRIDPRNSRTRFTFDLGGVLDVRKLDESEDSDIWKLYMPRRRVLSVRGDGTFSMHAGNTQGTYLPLRSRSS